MEAERRHFPRLAVSVPINYSVLSNGDHIMTKNLSAGGLCITIYDDIGVGSRLTLKIYLPGESSPVVVIGKIVWKDEFIISSDPQKRFEVGVEFVNIDDADRDKIYQYVFQVGRIET